jgi:hypothetical protein
MNTGELMLVPASAPGRFGVEFHDNGVEFHDNGTVTNGFYGTYDWLKQTGEETKKPRFGYHYNDSTFSPYPNWKTSSEMVNLFDFVHVPTRFADEKRADDGTVEREPGKINLNTVTEEAWNTLKNGRDDFPDYGTFRKYREPDEYNEYPSEFRPFRSPSAATLVPPLKAPDTIVGTPIDATLFRLEELIDDGADNPYLALEKAMRLSDVTTVRSNVFAVWITVGYFNAEQFEDFNRFREKYPDSAIPHITNENFKAVYPDGCVLGVEKGLDDGTVRRHRAFYLIDRSMLPAGFPFQRGGPMDTDEKNAVRDKVVIRKTEL